MALWWSVWAQRGAQEGQGGRGRTRRVYTLGEREVSHCRTSSPWSPQQLPGGWAEVGRLYSDPGPTMAAAGVVQRVTFQIHVQVVSGVGCWAGV